MIEISHAQARHLIRQGLDGRRLPNEQWSALQIHLETCPECAAYRDQLTEVERGLQRALRGHLDGSRRAPGIGASKEVTADVFLIRTTRKLRRKIAVYAGLAALVLLSVFFFRAYQLAMAPEPTPTQAPTPIGATATATPVVFTFRGVVAYSGPAQAGEPDGEPITAGNEIYLLNPGSDPGSGELVNLTQDPADDLAPAWSPDGEWVAFLSNRPKVTGGPQKYEVYVMHVAGSRLTRLTDEPLIEWRGPLSWSMDGEWLALTGSSGGRDSSSVYLVPVTRQAAGAEGPRRLAFTRGAPGPARFSPAAMKLAFAASEGQLQGIQVYDLTTGTFLPVTWEDTRVLSLKAGVEGQFDWSFDGERIAYVADGRYHPDTGGLVEAGARTRIKTTLQIEQYASNFSNVELEILAGTGVVRGLTTVPGEGNQAVVYLRDESAMDCWTIHLRQGREGVVDTQTVPRLCVLGGLSRESWKTAPGRGERPWLVVVARPAGASQPGVYALRFPAEAGENALLVERLGDLPFSGPEIEGPDPFLRVRPTGVTSLGLSPGEAAAPLGMLPSSATGQLTGNIVFSTGNRQDSQVMAIEADGSRLRALTVNAGENRCASYSPTGEKIAFVSDSGTRATGVNEVFLMDPDGVRVERLTAPRFEITSENASGPASRLLPYYDCPFWSPDGETLAVVAHSGAGDYLALLPTDGIRTPEYLRVDRVSPTAGLAWSPDGETLALVTLAENNAYVIKLLDVPSVADGSPSFSELSVAENGDGIYAIAYSGETLVYITLRVSPFAGASFRMNWVLPDGADARPAVNLPATRIATIYGSSRLVALADGRLIVTLYHRPEEVGKTSWIEVDSSSGTVSPPYVLEEIVYAAAWAPGGDWVVYAAENGLYALDFTRALQGSVSPALLYDGRPVEVDWR